MSSISDLAKQVVQNMNAKTDTKIETVKTEVIHEVKTEVVKEVIHDELNVDISGLATKEELQDAIPDVSGFANASDVYTKLDVNEMLNGKADKTSLDTLATKQEVEESKYNDTEVKDSISNLDNTKADKTELESLATKDELAAKADSENVYDKDSVYTKDEITNLLANKANLDQIIETYSKDKIDELLDLEANKDSIYTIEQTDILLAGKANVSDIPDVSHLATKEEVEEAKYDDTELRSSIDDITQDIADVINGKAEKSDLFKDGVFNTGWEDNDGSTHRFIAEKGDFGGIFSYNAPKNIKSYIGLNKSEENGNIDAQIYAINHDTRIGTRINLDAEKGAFYSKNSTNRGCISDDEIATMKDIPNVSDFVTTSQLNEKADKTEIPDISNLADKDSVAAVQNNIDALTLAVDSEFDTKADKSELDNYATKDYADSKQYNDTEIRSELLNKADKNEIPDVSNFLTAEDIENKADKSEIPDISGLATKEEVEESKYDDTEVKEELANKADKSDLDNLATKSEIPDVSNFITMNDVDTAIANKADKSEIPDVSNFATIDYVDSKAYDDTEIKADITALDTNKANKSDLFKNGVFNVKQTDQDGSYNLFFQEAQSGGGNQYFNSPTNTLSYIGLNKPSTAGSDVDCQIYCKDKTSNIGLRLNLSSTKGMFYLKNSLNLGFPADREVAVLGDLVDFYKKSEVDDALAEKADKTEIPNISGKLDASKVWNTSGNYFETKNTLSNGSYTQLWNENSGGGNLCYTQPKNTLTFGGVNHWSDNDKVAYQIYSKNRVSNIGVRISVNPDLGAFYTKGVTGGDANNFNADREIAVLADVKALLSRIETLEQKVAALEAGNN